MNFIDFQKKFPNELAVINYYVELRYVNRPVCHHCGSFKVYHRQDYPKKFQCMDCNNSFSVFKDTIFENSSTDMVKWMYAIHLFLNSKKGISGLQLMREVGVTYKTAWRMLKQIRVAMRNDDYKPFFEGVVEMDETYVGGKPRKGSKSKKDDDNHKPGGTGRGTDKTPVVGVLDRENKKVYAKVAKPNSEGKKLTGDQLLAIYNEVSKIGTSLITDEFSGYRIFKKKGINHSTINHSLEYCNGTIHTNGIESFWATLKRGIYGIYHSISDKYLQNYVDEFCFRYNNRNNKKVFDCLLNRTIVC